MNPGVDIVQNTSSGPDVAGPEAEPLIDVVLDVVFENTVIAVGEDAHVAMNGRPADTSGHHVPYRPD
jgi:hypothetical protein